MKKAENKIRQARTTFELLIDSGDFWRRFRDDIATARKNVYIQTLSFEGDSAGKALASEVMTSRAADKRVIVDYYTRYVLSDKFIYSPKNWFDENLKREVRDTVNMVNDLRSDGTRVKFVNPVGPLFVKMPLRNHKKILVIDDHISYIGGINFSDHNFEWHDIMLRIDNAEISAFLKEDFLASWEGRRFGGRRKFEDMEIFSFDGIHNRKAFEPIWELIDGAEDSIYVQSPYLSHPFTDRLRDAVGRGVKVTVVTPEKNNKKPMDSYSRWEAARSGFDLRLYQKGMTHLKAMLIDEKYLIIGSCNFDYFSYHFEEETVAVVTNREIIRDFIEMVINHDDQFCRPVTGPEKSLSGRLISLQIKALGRLLGLINRNKW